MLQRQAVTTAAASTDISAEEVKAFCDRVSLELATIRTHLEVQRLGVAVVAEFGHLLVSPVELLSQLLFRCVGCLHSVHARAG